MRYRLRKALTWLGIFLVALIAVGLITRAVFNYSTGKKLEKFLAQRKSEGVPLTVRDIDSECYPRDNAAVEWKIAEGTLSIEKEQRAILGQAIDDLFSGKPLEEEIKDQIRDLIAKNQEALGLILEASAKSCFKYEEQWDTLSEYLKIATAVKMIQGTRLLGIDAVIKAEDGYVEEGIEQCLAARRFLKLYLQEPFLISYLVGMACTKQVAVCMEYIVSGREMETETLKGILAEWDSSPWRVALVWALETEKIFGLESTLMYLKGEYDLDIGMAGDVFYWFFRPIIKNEIIWMGQVYDRLIEAAKMPYHASRNNQKIEQITDSIPWYYKMAGALVPNIRATLLKIATLEAIYDTARIGIACKIYRNLNGDFPEDLAELSPEIIENIPTDPFTGHSYIYKKQGQGFIVYSVGSNLRDEEGRGTWRITQLVMEKDDDWAWKEEVKKN